MFAGTIKKGISTKGYEETGLVDLSKIRIRHDKIAKEMQRRGMNHKSPDPIGSGGWIDIKANMQSVRRTAEGFASSLTGKYNKRVCVYSTFNKTNK